MKKKRRESKTQVNEADPQALNITWRLGLYRPQMGVECLKYGMLKVAFVPNLPIVPIASSARYKLCLCGLEFLGGKKKI